MDPLIERFRKLAAVDKDADLYWKLYLSGSGPERAEIVEYLDIILDKTVKKDFRHKILLDPEPDCNGEYCLGSVIYPDRTFSEFGLRKNEWLKHVLITGMTGTGKTNLCFKILQEFVRHKKPFLIFDWKKNYRDLLQLPEFRGTRVYTIGRKLKPFQFNPLIPPPKTEPGVWLMQLIDIIKHAYFLGDGVEYLLRHGIDAVYSEQGLYEGKTAYPMFSDVKAKIDKMALTGRMGLWKASTVRALASLTFDKGLGINLEHRSLPDIEILLNQNVVIELDALSNTDKVFFTEALILWIYEHRKNEATRETFKHAILIEEGHHVLSNQKEIHEGGETIIETSLRQIREFGEAVIVIDQEPSKLSNSIKANTFCKITFNLGNGLDILDMAKCMMLDPEETNYIDLLDVGRAIVKLKGRVFRPMFITTPLVSVTKGKITDALLENPTGFPPRV